MQQQQQITKNIASQSISNRKIITALRLEAKTYRQLFVAAIPNQSCKC